MISRVLDGANVDRYIQSVPIYEARGRFRDNQVRRLAGLAALTSNPCEHELICNCGAGRVEQCLYTWSTLNSGRTRLAAGISGDPTLYTSSPSLRVKPGNGRLEHLSGTKVRNILTAVHVIRLAVWPSGPIGNLHSLPLAALFSQHSYRSLLIPGRYLLLGYHTPPTHVR